MASPSPHMHDGEGTMRNYIPVTSLHNKSNHTSCSHPSRTCRGTAPVTTHTTTPPSRAHCSCPCALAASPGIMWRPPRGAPAPEVHGPRQGGVLRHPEEVPEGQVPKHCGGGLGHCQERRQAGRALPHLYRECTWADGPSMSGCAGAATSLLAVAQWPVKLCTHMRSQRSSCRHPSPA